MRGQRERGEGQMGCIVGLLVFLAAIFVAYKMIPIKVKAADLRQTVQDQAKTAGTFNDNQIRKAIMTKATDLQLPVTDEDLQITRSANRIVIDVKYTVPVVFPGYTYQWNFNHHADNPVF
jgi:predicted membrane protein